MKSALFGLAGGYGRPMADDTPDPPARHASAPAAGAASRWLAPVGLLVAVIALGLAVWSLQARAPEGVPAVANSEAPEKVGGSDADVCATFDTVSRAVSDQTNTDLGPDPVAQAAVAGNARLALLGGGDYLLSRLGWATSAQLADAAR